ncbi:peptidylprolyl isomerase [Blastopirellula retiformator]|uniref:Peptidylprolyl isomerase n=1 Tax=Blastopirellula retiformator TaxID=2527970 RepID=A0A5C5V4C2_9BACT|nr:peptidyl-prolyl cis-trans isomerase [Blastopirellula retiformator]TWT33396.1 peptidylprolyl isomerase [Blastopirellula retiformator]
MIRRSSISIFLVTFVVTTFGSLPWCAKSAQLHAQMSGLRSWLPWSGKSTTETTPTDPFKNRGGSAPDYRVADAQGAAQTPAPTTTPLPYPSNPYAAPGYTQQPSRRAVTTQIGDQPTSSVPAANGTTQPWRPDQYQQAASAWGQQQPPQAAATTPPTQSGYQPWQRTAAPSATPSQYGGANPYAPPSGYPTAGGSPNSNYSTGNYAPPVANGYSATNNVAPPATPAYPQGPPMQAPPVAADDKLFKPARIVALVGGQPILAGDILGPVNQAIAKRVAQLPEEQQAQVTEEILEEQRQLALRELLPNMIDTKMVYLDFIRTIPQDKLTEMQAHLDTQYAEYQMESDLKQYGVQTPAELDIALRKEGSSLEKKKRLFLEQIIAQQQLRTHVKPDTEVTHRQMLDFYHEHAAEYERPARARWEQLMVRFDKFNTKGEAEQAIADMGNQVLRGAPLDAVAKKHSQGFRASDGGQYDWTTRDSLKNETIDRAIFSLPPNRLSQIIESPEGYHIVRVLEREEDSMKPFRDAQLEIKEKIRNERANQAQREYITGVRKRTTVWTIFDEEKSSQTATSPSPESRR